MGSRRLAWRLAQAFLCLPLAQNGTLLLDKGDTIKGSSGPKAEETPAPPVGPGGAGGCRRPSSFSPRHCGAIREDG